MRMTTPPEAASGRFSEADRSAMRSALSMARRSLGATWPNPAVGCALYSSDGKLVSRGRTQPGGRPHAETEALAAATARGAAEALKGGTAYVSLEPCAHYGRTPPCAEALSKAGLARVVYAIKDPDVRVAGAGAEIMARSGLEVGAGLLEGEARELLAGYLLRQTAGRPRLTLKLAATLDGRIATKSGESRWISGEAARERAHLLRARSDAVLIGAGTARADDPMLDVRLPGLEHRKPVRLVADPSLSCPVDGRLLRTAAQHPVWLLAGSAALEPKKDALRKAGAEILEVATLPEGALDPAAMLARLGERGLTEVFCEGGGRLAASLLSAGLVDRLIWVSAGAAIGQEGAAAIGPLALSRLANAPRFDLQRMERVGADLWSEWTPSASADVMET